MHPSTHFYTNNGQTAENTANNLIVNYLPNVVDSTSLYHLFERFGSIESARVIRNKNREPLGYGFVKFVHAESAQRAITEMNGYSIENKKLKVSVARGIAMHNPSQLPTTSMTINPQPINSYTPPLPVIPYHPMISVMPHGPMFTAPPHSTNIPMNTSIGLLYPPQNLGFFATIKTPQKINLLLVPIFEPN